MRITALVILSICATMSPRLHGDERKDLLGDQLPDGALARLGTYRLRNSGPIFGAAVSRDGKLLAYAGTDQDTAFRGYGWDDPNAHPTGITIWDLDANKEVRRIPATNRPV